MLTKFEQECMTIQTESLRKLAGLMTEIMRDLGKMAEELHELNGHHPAINQSAMGPGDDEDSPF